MMGSLRPSGDLRCITVGGRNMGIFGRRKAALSGLLAKPQRDRLLRESLGWYFSLIHDSLTNAATPSELTFEDLAALFNNAEEMAAHAFQNQARALRPANGFPPRVVRAVVSEAAELLPLLLATGERHALLAFGIDPEVYRSWHRDTGFGRVTNDDLRARSMAGRVPTPSGQTIQNACNNAIDQLELDYVRTRAKQRHDRRHGGGATDPKWTPSD